MSDSSKRTDRAKSIKSGIIPMEPIENFEIAPGLWAFPPTIEKKDDSVPNYGFKFDNDGIITDLSDLELPDQVTFEIEEELKSDVSNFQLSAKRLLSRLVGNSILKYLSETIEESNADLIEFESDLRKEGKHEFIIALHMIVHKFSITLFVLRDLIRKKLSK